LEVRLVVLRACLLGTYKREVECRGDCAAKQTKFLLHREGSCSTVAVVLVAVAK
jgi:hypothetical protein